MRIADIKASNTSAGHRFGDSVAISNDTLLVGAWGENSGAMGVDGDQSDTGAPLAGAAYVFLRTGTNWSQQAYLKASNTAADDNFGWSLALSQDTAVVGARFEDSDTTGVNGNQNSEAADNSGAAYVFVRVGTTWTQQAYLKASNTGAADNFSGVPGSGAGTSVAVSGDTIAIGAMGEDSSATGINGDQNNENADFAGAVYVFVRSGTTWTQQAYLKASNTGTGDRFGKTVALSGDTLIVGAPQEDSNATGVNGDESRNNSTDSGAAYLFVRHGITWTQKAYLKASNTGPDDRFGFNVAVTDNTVVISGLYERSSAAGVNGNQADNSFERAGAVYLFATPIAAAPTAPLQLAQQAYLKASNPGGDDLFGEAVALSGDTMIVGANFEDSSGNDSGAAYVFVRDGTNWSQQAFLKASNPGAGDRFGYAVAVSGDTIVVGSVFESSNATGVDGNQNNNNSSGSGAAYVFVRNGTNWTQQAYLKASNTGAGDLFGSVAVSGDTIVVGAFNEDSDATGVNGDGSNNSAPESGAAYIFVRSGTTWSQQAYLKASNTGAGDAFNYVTVSGDTVVVGAIWEDSDATGINGDQSNNSATDSGAAYVFVRTGTNWTQQAYLKASNAGTFDVFGFVSLSGDTLVVGAFREDSNATGVNGNQTNNSATDSGAAYVFVRNGTNWSQQAYLKASNTAADDRFGWGAVSVSGDMVVLGAHQEDSNATGINGDQNNNRGSDSGAAYVFVRHGTNWSQQAYLKAFNTGAADSFGGGPFPSPGTSVSVSGGTVVIGAAAEDSNATGANGNGLNNSIGNSGAAYVFTGFCPSCPLLTLAPDASGGYLLRFHGVPGTLYRLQRATGVTGPWDTIATPITPVGGLIEHLDTNSLARATFYRANAP